MKESEVLIATLDLAVQKAFRKQERLREVQTYGKRILLSKKTKDDETKCHVFSAFGINGFSWY